MGFNTFPCNPYPISTEELNKGNNDDLNTRVTTLEGDVSDLNSNKANQITIAPFFNAETAYTAGNLVYYNGLTYRCTNDHEGEWDADDFAATTISSELDTLKSGLTNMGNIIKLGYVLGTGEVSLSDDMDNYRYLFFTVGYYDSGFPSYGTAMFPTLMAPRGVGARVVCATDDDTNAKSVVFTLDDTNNKLSVSGTYDANRYLTLYGVV